MNHRVVIQVRDHTQRTRIGEIGENKVRSRRHIFSCAAGQVVNHDNLLSSRNQAASKSRTDEPSASSDEDAHQAAATGKGTACPLRLDWYKASKIATDLRPSRPSGTSPSPRRNRAPIRRYISACPNP